MPNSKLKINDVARAANVSVSTVSRILNNRPDVADKTRARVLRVIDELGYSPNTQAQSLAAGQARTIALLFPMPHARTTQLELDFFVSASHAASSQGYNFNLLVNDITPESLLNLYSKAQVAGVILMQIALSDWRVDLLRKNNLPFVMIGRCADNTGLSYVDYDFEGGVRAAFAHLQAQGHQQIGFLTRSQASYERGLGSAVRLRDGFFAVCDALQLAPIYREAETQMDAVYRATDDMLAAQPGLSAIVTVNGMTAPAIVRAARARDKQVPANLSVVAVGTNSIAEIIEPTLTTVSFPSAQMGTDAANMLIQHINSKDHTAEQILLPAELVERESSAPYTGNQ
ncbi:MAG: LacI family DNA-binding transcriptional regulator [Chloroflexota bacterium]